MTSDMAVSLAGRAAGKSGWSVRNAGKLVQQAPLDRAGNPGLIRPVAECIKWKDKNTGGRLGCKRAARQQ